MTQLPNHLVNKWQTPKRGGGIAALLRFGYEKYQILIRKFQKHEKNREKTKKSPKNHKRFKNAQKVNFFGHCQGGAIRF